MEGDRAYGLPGRRGRVLKAPNYSWDEAVTETHSRGLSNRAIAAEVGCHRRTVADALRRAGLAPNRPRGKPPREVDGGYECRVCLGVLPLSAFALVRSREDGRKFSICRSCRRDQNRRALADPKRYFADRQSRLRGRARRAGIPYDLPDGWLETLWARQRGKCFYSSAPLVLALGRGTDPLQVSVDRIDPSLGYLVTNVVLCSYRVNTIKRDVTPEEMRAWMPGWALRVERRLPNLSEGRDHVGRFLANEV